MTEPADIDVVRSTFANSRPWFLAMASELVPDPDAVVSEAEAHFDALIPTMAYADRPGHPMASSVFSCEGLLALYLALRERGVDVHDYGAVMLETMPSLPMGDGQAELTTELFTAMVDAAAESQREARPGEFVYELVGPEDGANWGMNVLSCAICASYAKHDAMDLVPYMCAGDDVVSDAFGQGLRRTGTIALGAHRCDFRYKHGGEPSRLAEQYPQRIRIRTSKTDA